MATTMLSTAQVAKRYNKDPRQVTYARKTGKLKAVRVGDWNWVFPEEDLPEIWPIRNKRKVT